MTWTQVNILLHGRVPIYLKKALVDQREKVSAEPSDINKCFLLNRGQSICIPATYVC